MDTDRATKELPAVADKIVGVGADRARVAFHEGDVLRSGRGEWMVQRHPAPFRLAPLEHGVLFDEGEGESVFVSQAQARRVLGAQGIGGLLASRSRVGDHQ